jgi:hypothetical protein
MPSNGSLLTVGHFYVQRKTMTAQQPHLAPRPNHSTGPRIPESKSHCLPTMPIAGLTGQLSSSLPKISSLTRSTAKSSSKPSPPITPATRVGCRFRPSPNSWRRHPEGRGQERCATQGSSSGAQGGCRRGDDAGQAPVPISPGSRQTLPAGAFFPCRVPPRYLPCDTPAAAAIDSKKENTKRTQICAKRIGLIKMNSAIYMNRWFSENGPKSRLLASVKSTPRRLGGLNDPRFPGGAMIVSAASRNLLPLNFVCQSCPPSIIITWGATAPGGRTSRAFPKRILERMPVSDRNRGGLFCAVWIWIFLNSMG